MRDAVVYGEIQSRTISTSSTTGDDFRKHQHMIVHPPGLSLLKNKMAKALLSRLDAGSGLIAFADLGVEGPEIVKNTQPEQPDRHQVQETSPPFAHVKSVNSEQAEEGEQGPGDRIIDGLIKSRIVG